VEITDARNMVAEFLFKTEPFTLATTQGAQVTEL
jgi:hypothetical protein